MTTAEMDSLYHRFAMLRFHDVLEGIQANPTPITTRFGDEDVFTTAVAHYLHEQGLPVVLETNRSNPNNVDIRVGHSVLAVYDLVCYVWLEDSWRHMSTFSRPFDLNDPESLPNIAAYLRRAM